MKATVLVLVDADVAGDRRVLATLAEYTRYEIVDLRRMPAGGAPGFCACLRACERLFSALPTGRAAWSALLAGYRLRATRRLGGLRVSLRSYLRAQQLASLLRLQASRVGLIHAHDLFCGVVGYELARSMGVNLVYDAHEVEFHRHRNNSWWRTAFDVAVEHRVVRQAREVRVVNRPIAELYQRIHHLPAERLRVVTNDHFAFRAEGSDTLPVEQSLTLVYVGGGTRGRQLERLAAEAKRLQIPVHAFFVGEIPAVASEGGWLLGPSDYEDALLTLVATQRCVMWCCVDDVCLSYRLALPNKFFQALAVGIPVVASAGTYLADLVSGYRLGCVFDGQNFAELIATMREAAYADCVRAVHRFRDAVRTGSLKV